MSIERWPYTNIHNLNLDWILEKIKEFSGKIDVFTETIEEYTGKTDQALITIQEKIDYIDNFFSNLDVQQEINNKLDDMTETGELANILRPFADAYMQQTAPGVISAWLAENITPTSPAVDASLTVAGAAADAKAAGDAIRENSRLLTESALPVNYAVVSTATKTHNGLSFTANGGVVTISGTSTGVSYFDLFNMTSQAGEFPFKTGHKYAVRYKDSTTPLIYKQVEYDAGGSHVSLYSKKDLSDAIIFTMPSCNNFYIRLVCDAAGYTYNKTITFNIEDVTESKRPLIVDANGNGDFIRLIDGIRFASETYGNTLIVKPAVYNLVAEYGKAYLDQLSDNNADYGLMLGNGLKLIFAPKAYVSFDYDGSNPWIMSNFSPFNTGNDLGYTIDGLHCTAHNCRYILHDDPRPGKKTQYSYNIIKNCYFEMYPSPNYPDWINHQIIGGGFGDCTLIVIENCIFNDHFSGASQYAALSYHNSTSGSPSFESRLIIKDNVFADGNQIIIEGYGSSTFKSKVIITNNNLQNAQQNIKYISSAADNIALYQWNNFSR